MDFNPHSWVRLGFFLGFGFGLFTYLGLQLGFQGGRQAGKHSNALRFEALIYITLLKSTSGYLPNGEMKVLK